MKHRVADLFSNQLLIHMQTKSIPTSLTFSPNQSQFVTLALPLELCTFSTFLTGKLTRTYDESLSAASEMQQAGTAVIALDDMDFGRRLALERDLDAKESGPVARSERRTRSGTKAATLSCTRACWVSRSSMS